MKVKVLSNLDHDNVSYKAGDEVDLPEDVVKTLEAAGTVEVVRSGSKPSSESVEAEPEDAVPTEPEVSEAEEKSTEPVEDTQPAKKPAPKAKTKK